MKIELSRHQAGVPLNHYWSACVGAGRANEGLRAGWLEQLALAVRECGFERVRFHGLFHDDMFVYREKAGKPIYNWQYIDDLFDHMLELGVRPFIELGFCPKDLARDTSTVMWWKGNVAAPKDFSKWADLVEAFARHLIARYGAAEVTTWYFEVWNEPNLEPFFRGTRSEYFELYKVSVQALRKVDGRLKVGGPSTSNFVCDERFAGEKEDGASSILWQTQDLDSLTWKGVWIEAFLAFCASAKLPVDFVSTHPYPTDFGLDGHGVCRGRSRSVSSLRSDLEWLNAVIRKSAYPQAEIHLTEWSSSPSSRDHSHDSLPAAAYIVQANLDAIGLAHSLSYWAFTDVFEELGAGDSVFHGGFGLINYQGIIKPTFHAYRFLHRLGDELLARGAGWVLSRRSGDGGLAGIIWHYPPELKHAVPMTSTPAEAQTILETGTPEELHLILRDLPPGATFQVEVLDADHGHVLKTWQKLGHPEPPTREQAALLREEAFRLDREILMANDKGELHLKRTLQPWAVVSIVQFGTKG